MRFYESSSEQRSSSTWNEFQNSSLSSASRWSWTLTNGGGPWACALVVSCSSGVGGDFIIAGSLTSGGENVNRYYSCPEFEHTLPPRAGDGVETQEVGPPPLISLISNREQPFQNTDAAPNLEANPNQGQDGLVQSMVQLMQAQTNVLTAHAQAVAMQNLPALSPFSGEDPQGDEDNFEKWLELLEERGKLAQWSKEQHLCQLRAHLTKKGSADISYAH